MKKCHINWTLWLYSIDRQVKCVSLAKKSHQIPNISLSSHYELGMLRISRRCNPFPLILASPLTVYTWSVHCKCALVQNSNRLSTIFIFWIGEEHKKWKWLFVLDISFISAKREEVRKRSTFLLLNYWVISYCFSSQPLSARIVNDAVKLNRDNALLIEQLQ